MRVFVAGASGAVGRPLVRRLIAGGHLVTAMTRREAAKAEIEAQGATCVLCDVFDAEALSAAVGASQPDVVVHMLTALPAKLELGKKGVYDANNRIRTEGTRNLVAAAERSGASRMVAESIAFIYAPTGRPVKSEDAPLIEGLAGEFGDAVVATRSLEQQVLGAEGLDGLVLRYGFFYGPGTSYASDGHQASEVRRRRFPIVGRGDGVFSYVHVDDAAAAAATACERGAPGVYNVCDDEPAPLREWLPVYAEAVGAKPPLRVPKLLARIVAGRAAVEFATTLRGASNEKAKRELGWRPDHPSWRTGFTEALG